VSDLNEDSGRAREGRGSRILHAITFALLAAALGCSAPEPPVAPQAAASTPAGVVRIATSGDYAPFSVWPDGGTPEGFSVAVGRAFAADHDLTIEWVRFRWSTLASDLAEDRFDVALSGVTVRPDRTLAGRFSLPLATSGAMLLVPKSSSIRSPADLDRPSRSVAVNAGGHLERVARRLFPAARIEAIPDNAAVLDRLALDRSAGGAGPPGVDAVLTDSLEAPLWQHAAKRPLRAIGPLTRDHKAAWLPRDRGALADRLDRWLLRAEAEGRLDLLRRAHGLPGEPTALPLPALLAKMDERLALMPEVARVKAVLGRPIEDREREARVLAAAVDSVEAAARIAGRTPPTRLAIRTLFGAQIEAAKWIQRRTLEASPPPTATASPSARDAARARLEDVLRPVLIELGDRIAMLLVASAGDVGGEGPLGYDRVAVAFGGHGLPEPELRALHGALVDALGPSAAAGRSGADGVPADASEVSIRPRAGRASAGGLRRPRRTCASRGALSPSARGVRAPLPSPAARDTAPSA
jgi:cyclohexadienyl dehydratase